jgi:hypothetical protein
MKIIGPGALLWFLLPKVRGSRDLHCGEEEAKLHEFTYRETVLKAELRRAQGGLRRKIEVVVYPSR